MRRRKGVHVIVQHRKFLKESVREKMNVKLFQLGGWVSEGKMYK